LSSSSYYVVPLCDFHSNFQQTLYLPQEVTDISTVHSFICEFAPRYAIYFFDRKKKNRQRGEWGGRGFFGLPKEWGPELRAGFNERERND
jgi:hypothetical protein